MTTNTSTISSPTPSTRADRPPALQRVGALAALVKAATYLIGFAVMGAYLAPRGFLDAQGDPGRSLDFLLDNQMAMYVWYAILYLAGGFALVILVQALRARMAMVPGVAGTAAVLGFTWSGLLLASGLIALVGQRAVVDLNATDPAVASATWSSVSVVQDALGGGIEIVGALWVLMVAITGVRTGTFGRGHGIFGAGVGIAGVATLVPAAADAAAAAFGVGMIAWFIWTALALLGRR